MCCEPGVPFKWPKGLRLQACGRVTVLLPAELIAPDQTIYSVIEAPDDARVSFDPSTDGQGVTAIRIVLEADSSMLLHRSSMAMVAPEDPGPVRFVVLSASGER